MEFDCHEYIECLGFGELVASDISFEILNLSLH
jgi:hypothetical protein